MSFQYWITGRPATFATRSEAPWKEKIISQIGNRKNENNSLELEFNILNENYEQKGFDIDNLCDPVFTALTSKLGWYNGSQVNIISYRAIKIKGGIEGMVLKDIEKIDFAIEKATVQFDEIFKGSFPKNARDPQIPDWLSQFNNLKNIKGECGLALRFGTKKRSIASISDGIVKHIIDCMYPIFGGKPGAPDDHLISDLYVQKSVDGLSENEVRITVYQKWLSILPD